MELVTQDAARATTFQKVFFFFFFFFFACAFGTPVDSIEMPGEFLLRERDKTRRWKILPPKDINSLWSK